MIPTVKQGGGSEMSGATLLLQKTCCSNPQAAISSCPEPSAHSGYAAGEMNLNRAGSP